MEESASSRPEPLPDSAPVELTGDGNSGGAPTSPTLSPPAISPQQERDSQDQPAHATPSPRLPPDFDFIKRDSGIAPSFNIPDPAHPDAVPSSSSAIHDPPPAVITTHDARAGANNDTVEEVRPASDIPRIGSLKGIQSPPDTATALRDISLGDLASDRVEFSKRGSLLYSGKRMNEPANSKRECLARSTEENDTSAIGAGAVSHQSAPGKVSVKGPETDGEKYTVSGQTTPAITTSRVLSAEDMTFSTRVRSMYEHGSERAVSWTTPTLNGIHENEVANSFTTDSGTPEPTSNGLTVDKTRQTPPEGLPNTQSSPAINRPASAKEANEFAGGIEDWEDIDGQDVDRYGFINPKRLSSRSSGGEQAPNEGIQRVATRLKVPADRSRKNRGLRRAASGSARSSRSLPLTGRRGDQAGAPSVYSARTHQTGVNLQAQNMFRSKDRRAVIRASDMLTLPPGLAQIAEAADGGRTASALKRKEWAREEKWQKMAKDNSLRRPGSGKGGGMRFEFDTNDPKLISRTWKGIPDRWRATAWHSFLSSSAKKRRLGASDEDLIQQYVKLQEEGSADDVQIDMDVPRTINLHVMFRRRYRGGQRLLFRVLHAISLYFPDTGYVQGMASLAATLLCYFEEETAFVMLVRLWQLRGLEQLFAAGFGGLMKALEDLERDWLFHGDVAKHLDELGVTSTAYGTRWYLTLFNMSIPFPAQLRVWDVFMLLGDAPPGKAGNSFGGADLDVLHATSAALIDAAREIVLDSDFENAMKVLTSFVPIKDEDLLMRVAKAEWKQRKKRG